MHATGKALESAAEISRVLVTVADTGDADHARRLDAERLQLLESVKGKALTRADRELLREISELNDRAIGLLEHRRRCKARDLDMLSIGRRAVRAYAGAERHRSV